jgi:hypothetical protein
LQSVPLMANEVRKTLLDGVRFGIVAGIIFAVVQVAAAALSGAPLEPLRMSSSVLLGPDMAHGASLGVAALIGLGVHLALSALFGLLYGLIDGANLDEHPRSWGRQAPVGLLYGFAIWLLDFQVVGRISHPWFLGAPQLAQAALHALFFGLPLALFYVRAERQMRPALALPLAA